jgi:DUF1680 family protein
MNALCSAAKAYTSLGSKKHLQAAVNGFRMVQEQSYATGGWGPDESFLEPDSDQLKKSLTKTHHSFETCGAYAHMKLSRYLLCFTHDSAYGDSMERVIYNTVLGVKPLLPDGSAFYYSDYNMRAKKSYYWFKCPCCAGTLPQIVADFGICTYFQDGQGVLVNLYIPSELKWNNKGTDVTLTQTTNYPYASSCKFEVKTCAPTDFDLRLRIPQWSRSAILTVNGKRLANPQVGKFASIARTWQTGDIVELTLPLPVRLEAIDNKNPDTVALLRGPLVLFAVTDDAPVVNRKQLLAVRSISPENDRFAVEATSGPVDFRPFSEIDAEQYVTYLKVTN